MRRFRPAGLRKEPRHRRPPQRRPLPLHQLDQEGVQERRRDPAGQRHHAPDQPGEDVAGDPQRPRRGLPGHLCRHRQPHPACRRPGRDRHRCWRPGSRERDARPRLVDAPAGNRRRRADRQAGAEHHRHRPGAGPDRIPAQAESRRRLPGVPRRGCPCPDPGRPRHHLQHGPGIWRHCGDVRHRPADHRLPAPDRPRRAAGQAGGNLCQGHRPVGRQPGRCSLRAHPELRPVERGAQHGRPVQPARARGYQRPGSQRHRRQLGRSAGADAGRRGDHCRHHQLHQHQQPAQRDCRRPAGAQCQQAGPGPQTVGQVVAGAWLQGRAAVPGRGGAGEGTGAARLRHRRLCLHHLQRYVRRPGPGDPARNHRPRPVRHRRAVGQPQLRRAYPPVCQAGLPRLAATGGGLRHRRYHPLRHREGCAGRGRRQGNPPQGHLAQRRRDRRRGACRGQAGAVPQGVHPDVRHRGRPWAEGGAAVRLAPDEHLHPPPAVLGRCLGR
ncbi:hypothetical protein D3C76_787490 [compost metagenome]